MEQHVYKRDATSAERAYSVEGDRLIVRQEGAVTRAMALADIARIQLSVAPAGSDAQLICRVETADGEEIVFGSATHNGAGYERNTLSFQDVLTDLHEGLQPRWDEVRFIEGGASVLTNVLAISGAGAAVGGLGVFIGLTLINGDPVGWAGAAVGLAGAWIAHLFRPRGAKTYDPAIYSRR